MKQFQDYYAILKVDVNATNTELRKAYLKCCKEWHPDKNPGIDTTKMMQVINEAKDTLLDPIKRAAYDVLYKNFLKHGKQQQPNIKEQDQYDQQEKSKQNKQRYKKLKQRASAFKNNNRFMYGEYLGKIKNNTNKELIDVCLDWYNYTIEFVDMVVMELHETRNYEIDSIYNLIKEKPIYTSTKKIAQPAWIRWFF